MYSINAQSPNRPIEERKSHGVPHEKLSYETPPNSYYGSPLKGETPLNVSKTWGAYGSYKAPLPQIIDYFQEEPELGQKDLHEEYVDKIKQPLLYIDVVPKVSQPDPVRQKVVEHEKTNHSGCRTCWLW
jgi:hypothetical protein